MNIDYEYVSLGLKRCICFGKKNCISVQMNALISTFCSLEEGKGILDETKLRTEIEALRRNIQTVYRIVREILKTLLTNTNRKHIQTLYRIVREVLNTMLTNTNRNNIQTVYRTVREILNIMLINTNALKGEGYRSDL